ncbi:MAG: DUF4198 domain-containing protein [Campylobacteraceae bacterium]|nr:DUF4198 domain-containing protein [Campylobacteraceae bacterium]
MKHKKFSLASKVLVLTLIFGTTALAHLPYVLPLQFHTDQNVVTLYAGLSDKYFEPEMPGGGAEGGYDITVTNPSGKTKHAEYISRHKQLTLIEINTPSEGTYKVNRTLLSAALPHVVREGKAVRVLDVVSPERRKELEAQRTEERRFLFRDEVKPDEIEDVQIINHVITYVTRDKPNEAALKPVGKGFEFDFKTHPNSVSVKSGIKLTALIDGEAAPEIIFDFYKQGVDKTIHSAKSDHNGIVNVRFNQSGIYVLRAQAPLESVKDGKIVNTRYINWLIIEVKP